MRTPEELAETVAFELDNLALGELDMADAWDRFHTALRDRFVANTEAFRRAAQASLDGIDWEVTL